MKKFKVLDPRMRGIDPRQDAEYGTSDPEPLTVLRAIDPKLRPMIQKRFGMIPLGFVTYESLRVGDLFAGSTYTEAGPFSYGVVVRIGPDGISNRPDAVISLYGHTEEEAKENYCKYRPPADYPWADENALHRFLNLPISARDIGQQKQYLILERGLDKETCVEYSALDTRIQVMMGKRLGYSQIDWNDIRAGDFLKITTRTWTKPIPQKLYTIVDGVEKKAGILFFYITIDPLEALERWSTKDWKDRARSNMWSLSDFQGEGATFYLIARDMTVDKAKELMSLGAEYYGALDPRIKSGMIERFHGARLFDERVLVNSFDQLQEGDLIEVGFPISGVHDFIVIVKKKERKKDVSKATGRGVIGLWNQGTSPWPEMSKEIALSRFYEARLEDFKWHNEGGGLSIVPWDISLNWWLWGRGFKRDDIDVSILRYSSLDPRVRARMESRFEHHLRVDWKDIRKGDLLKIVDASVSIKYAIVEDRINNALSFNFGVDNAYRDDRSGLEFILNSWLRHDLSVAPIWTSSDWEDADFYVMERDLTEKKAKDLLAQYLVAEAKAKHPHLQLLSALDPEIRAKIGQRFGKSTLPREADWNDMREGDEMTGLFNANGRLYYIVVRKYGKDEDGRAYFRGSFIDGVGLSPTIGFAHARKGNSLGEGPKHYQRDWKELKLVARYNWSKYSALDPRVKKGLEERFLYDKPWVTADGLSVGDLVFVEITGKIWPGGGRYGVVVGKDISLEALPNLPHVQVLVPTAIADWDGPNEMSDEEEIRLAIETYKRTKPSDWDIDSIYVGPLRYDRLKQSGSEGKTGRFKVVRNVDKDKYSAMEDVRFPFKNLPDWAKGSYVRASHSIDATPISASSIAASGPYHRIETCYICKKSFLQTYFKIYWSLNHPSLHLLVSWFNRGVCPFCGRAGSIETEEVEVRDVISL